MLPLGGPMWRVPARPLCLSAHSLMWDRSGHLVLPSPDCSRAPQGCFLSQALRSCVGPCLLLRDRICYRCRYRWLGRLVGPVGAGECGDCSAGRAPPPGLLVNTVGVRVGLGTETKADSSRSLGG